MNQGLTLGRNDATKLLHEKELAGLPCLRQDSLAYDLSLTRFEGSLLPNREATRVPSRDYTVEDRWILVMSRR
jgi:hypothetical protein